MIFQTLLRSLFILLGNEVKVAPHEELAEQSTGVIWAVCKHMLGETDERQPLGFRIADEPCLYSLGIELKELACVFEVLKANVV
jgi:hypothetical protein